MRGKYLRKMVIFALVAVMLMAVPAGAIEFSDVQQTGRHAWAYDYIMEMAEKEIINGYPDGTFKPDASVTFLETMKLLAELRPLTEQEKPGAASRYSDLMIELEIPTWALEAVVTNLVHGVTTEKELRNAHEKGMTVNGTTVVMDRLTVSISLARALNLDDSDKQYASLIYEDTEEIRSNYFTHIAALIDIGVLNPHGRDGKFEPFSPIKRAEVSKMIKIAYDYIEQNPIQSTVEEATFVGTVQGNSVVSNTLTVDSSEGRKTFIVTDRTEVVVDGRSAKLDDVMTGNTVTVIYDGNTNRALSIDAKSLVQESGDPAMIVEAPGTSDRIVLEVGRGNETQTLEYTLAPHAQVQDDGKIISPERLANGDRVFFQEADGQVIFINRQPRSSAVTGILTEVGYSRTRASYIVIKTNQGVNQKIEVAPNAEIIKSGVSSRLDDLTIGDTVAVKLEYGIAISIDSTSAKQTVRGMISGITHRFGGYTELIIDSGGDIYGPLAIAENATVKIDGYNVDATQLRVDYEGEFTLEGKEVTGIYVNTRGGHRTYDTLYGEIVDIRGDRVEIELLRDTGDLKRGQTFWLTDYGDIDARFHKFKIGDTVTVNGYINGRDFEVKEVY